MSEREVPRLLLVIPTLSFVLLGLFVVIGAVPEKAVARSITDRLSINGFAMVRAIRSRRDTGDSDFTEINPIYLNFHYRFNRNLEALLEFEGNHLPESTEINEDAEAEIERAYVQYTFNDQHHFQVGKFFVPAGIWMPRHWRILAPTYDRVIFSENQEFYLVDEPVGIHYFGRRSLTRQLDLTYDLWTSDGRDSYSSHHREHELDNPGANLSLLYEPTEGSRLDSLQLGAAFEYVKASSRFPYDRRTSLVFTGLELFDGTLNLTAELADVELSGSSKYPGAGSYRDLNDWYGSVQYQLFPRWWTYYRYERGDDAERSRPGRPNQAVLASQPDPETEINTAAVFWRPYPHTKIELEYNQYHFKDDPRVVNDYDQIQFSIGRLF